MNKLYDGAYGLRIFKPYRVEHSITIWEFLDVLGDYLKERFKITAHFEFKNDKDNGGQLFLHDIRSTNQRDTNNSAYAQSRLIQCGFDQTDGYKNFKTAMNLLFQLDNIKSGYEIYPDEEFNFIIFIQNGYDDFIRVGADKAKRLSESV